MSCPNREDGVHDCTGVGQRCACGYQFTVPPISVSIEIFNRSITVYDDHFNCDTLDVAISGLREALRAVEAASRHGVRTQEHAVTTSASAALKD